MWDTRHTGRSRNRMLRGILTTKLTLSHTGCFCCVDSHASISSRLPKFSISNTGSAPDRGGGASVLITGFPGTAKTTLSGAFAEASCRRGDRTMFVSFDSDGTEVIRNLASVGIRLDRYVKSGLLHMVSARTITGSAETYLVRIKSLALAHKSRCVGIDPVSTLRIVAGFSRRWPDKPFA